MKTQQLSLLLAAAALGTLSASADIIFDNFGPGDSFSATGRILEGENVGQIADVDQAASFTVGSESYFLTTITLGIGVDQPPNAGAGPLGILIAADDSGVPGMILQEVEELILVTGDQTVTAAFPGTLLLDANTTYWVIADGRDEFNGAWRFNEVGDTGDTAGRSNGNPWNLRPDDVRYAFRVEGRVADIPVIPEPGAGAAVGAALFGMGLYTWRRSRAKA
jgi:hypothetical protein